MFTWTQLCLYATSIRISVSYGYISCVKCTWTLSEMLDDNVLLLKDVKYVKYKKLLLKYLSKQCVCFFYINCLVILFAVFLLCDCDLKLKCQNNVKCSLCTYLPESSINSIIIILQLWQKEEMLILFGLKWKIILFVIKSQTSALKSEAGVHLCPCLMYLDIFTWHRCTVAQSLSFSFSQICALIVLRFIAQVSYLQFNLYTDI